MVVRSTFKASVFVLAFAAPALAGNVWIVDAAMGPGAQFADIAPAVFAASNGDVVLVRSGAYSGFVSQKALAICADAGATVTISSASGGSVMLTPFGMQSWLHGVSGSRLLAPSSIGSGGGLLVSDCTFVASMQNQPGVEVAASGPVILDHVHSTGAAGLGFAAGGFGLRSGLADVAAYDSTFIGGAGVDASTTSSATAGGAGVHALVTTKVFLSRCTAQGGKGGNGSSAGGCQAPSVGGAGLLVLNNAAAFLSDTPCTGGAGGTAAAGCGANGADGPSISGPSTTLVSKPTLDVTTIVREGQQGAVQSSMLPGLNAVMIGSLQAFQSVPPLHGLLHVGNPVLVVTLPPSGLMTFTLSDLGVGVPYALLRAQAVHADPATQSVELGQTCGMLLLDAAY